MNIYLSEMQEKDIISVENGMNLGHIVDIEINTEGKIINFVAQNKKIFKKKDDEKVFTFNNIEKIGEDVILVRN